MARFNSIACALAAGATVFAAGCGGGEGAGPDAAAHTPDAPVDEPTINGKPASKFYGQFAYQTTRSCVAGAAAFPTQADGRNAFLIRFFLMPDHQLKLFYAEAEGEVTATGWSLNTRAGTLKRRSGDWKIEGTTLVLDSFVQCNGITFNDRDQLHCTLTSSIVTSIAQGHAGRFDPCGAAVSPDDSVFANYVD